MIRRFAIFFSAILSIAAAEPQKEELPRENPFYETSSGIQQINKIMNELKTSMGDIPPEVEKVAMYQLRTDKKDFTPSVANYIQSLIESTFKNYARVAVVSPPELKTLTVVSTDTSFYLSNTIPTLGELWKLGDKLKIDAYLQGSCGKSQDGDVMLNLKLIKHKSAEILWSGDYMAGPNKVKPSIWDLKWTASAPIRFFPIDKFRSGDRDTTGARVKAEDARLNSYSVQGTVSEALLQSKRLWFSMTAGFSIMSFFKSNDVYIDFTRAYAMYVGIDLLAIIINKKNSDRGYWLGVYGGGQYLQPFLFRGEIMGFTHGYKSQLSQHFSLSGGIMWKPGTSKLTGTSLNKDIVMEMSSVAYEFNILNFTF